MIKAVVYSGQNIQGLSYLQLPPLRKMPIAMIPHLVDLRDPMGDPMMQEAVNLLSIDEEKLFCIVDIEAGSTYLHEILEEV